MRRSHVSTHSLINTQVAAGPLLALVTLDEIVQFSEPELAQLHDGSWPAIGGHLAFFHVLVLIGSF